MLHLLTLDELAAYVNRHPTILRKYYMAGMLPEPDHCIVHKTKTTRRFTQREADNIKYLFDHATYGTFAKKRDRARKRGIIRIRMV